MKKFDFQYKNIHCRIVWDGMLIDSEEPIEDVSERPFTSNKDIGHYCGYIFLPTEDKRINKLSKISVHGGITCNQYDEETGSQKIGFDMAHGFDWESDYKPDFTDITKIDFDKYLNRQLNSKHRYKINRKMVKTEIQSMVDQLEKLK